MLLEVGPMQSDAIRCNQMQSGSSSEAISSRSARCNQMQSDVLGGHRRSSEGTSRTARGRPSSHRLHPSRLHAPSRWRPNHRRSPRGDATRCTPSRRRAAPSPAIRCNPMQSYYIRGIRKPSTGHQRAIRGPSLGNHLMFRERAGGCMHVAAEGGANLGRTVDEVEHAHGRLV